MYRQKHECNEQLREYLNGCLKDVIQEAVAAGIPIQAIEPEVVINTRAKSFWGRCTAVISRSAASTVYRIEVTTRLIGTDESSIKNTLMHEVIHTCKGCMSCGRSQGYKRAGKVVTEPQNYRCRCGGRIIIRGL